MRKHPPIPLALAILLAYASPALSQPTHTNETKAAPAENVGQRLDFSQYMTIPAERVMGWATYDYVRPSSTTKGDDRLDREEIMKKLAALPDKRRRLATLYLLDKFGKGPLLRDFLADRNGDLAPEVLEALLTFDIQPQAKILAEALTLYGPEYPRDAEKRHQFFAGAKAKAFLEKNRDRMSDKAVMDEFGRLLKADEFDVKLDAYTGQFKAMPELRLKLRALILDTPELSVWVAEERARLSDEARLDLLLRSLGPDMNKENFRYFPKPYRQLYLAEGFNFLMIIGGPESFFSSEIGDFAQETADALRDIGLPKWAALVEEGINAFPAPYPIEAEERKKMLTEASHSNNSLKQKLSALKQSINRSSMYFFIVPSSIRSSPLSDAMIAYAKRENVLPR